MNELEIWGGLECTLNRINDIFYDQCRKNGHYDRPDDLRLFSEVGFKKIRYPFLWELASPKKPNEYDWSYFDRRMNELKNLNITPICGFLHHGSGPFYTNLIDHRMPALFARYAKAFAERYPWISDYTPINEILTTARFSCLYGHWYPHLKDDYHFMKATFIQCRATVLAMREIRKINPQAKFIQTEDIGKCQSTTSLNYQRDFENERRWLSFDILSGRVNAKHPLYKYIIQCGISNKELEWHQKNICRPDIIGINHYHLSNRFLDHKLKLYPVQFHGGNHLHQYADVGVLDTGQASLPRPFEIILEVHKRFNLPIAITEVHMRGHREEQIKWFHQIWKESQKAREEGANIVAITAWSLLGSFDWNSLCTKNAMIYEPGVFDLRGSNVPRKTALAQLIEKYNRKKEFEFPLMNVDPIWMTTRRILYAARRHAHSILEDNSKHNHKVVLITGATGTLGKAFAKICRQRNIPYKLLGRKDLELSDLNAVRSSIKTISPWAIINCAGYVKIDEAEKEKDLCFRENVTVPSNLAVACEESKIQFVHFSSDLVFNGRNITPYHEDNTVDPLNIYGMSKVMSEKKIQSIYPSSLIIRSSAFFGPWDEYNFATLALKRAVKKEIVFAANDCKVSPTYIPDLVHATLDLMMDGAEGIHHLINDGEITWSNFANMLLQKSKIQNATSYIVEKKMEEITKVKRPQNSSLTTKKVGLLPPLEEAVERFLVQRNI